MFSDADSFLREASSSADLGEPFLSNPNAKTFSFDEKNFRSIKSSSGSSVAGVGSNGLSVAGVDSGSVNVFSTPSLSVGFARTFYNVFKDGLRLKQEKNDFLIVTKLVVDGRDCKLASRVFPSNASALLPLQEHLLFDANDESIGLHGTRALPSDALPVVRKYLEWIACSEAAKHADLVVKDGSLTTRVTNEDFYARKFFDSRAIPAALSKTCSLVTTTGVPLVSAVEKISPKNESWVYNPVYENNAEAYDFFIVKFHRAAKHSFRFELLKPKKDLLDGVLGELSYYSTDLSFLGYPYVLLDADKNGRVTEREASVINSFLQFKLGSDWASIESDAFASNAHDFLDFV